MRTWMSILLLAAVALSGCAQESTDFEPTSEPMDEQGDEPVDDVPEEKTEDPAPTENATNTAPEATLTADVSNGTAPLNVTLTLDGSDVDGDLLTWSLTLDGDEIETGTELPAEVTMLFEAAGNFTVVLSIDDGEATANATQVITATEALPTGPFATIEAAWDYGATEAPSLADYFLCEGGPSNGVTHEVVALPAGAGGRTFTATLTAETGSETITEWGFYTFAASACDGTGDDFFGEAVAPVGDGVSLVIAGTIPAEADTILAYSTGGAGLALDLVLD